MRAAGTGLPAAGGPDRTPAFEGRAARKVSEGHAGTTARLSGALRWAAIIAVTAAVIVLIVLLDPRAGPAKSVAPITWILGSAANGGAILVFFLLAGCGAAGPGRRPCSGWPPG